jgi:hypothetical protein
MTEFIKALKDEGWFNSDVVKLEIKGIEFLKKLWEMSYLSLVSTGVVSLHDQLRWGSLDQTARLYLLARATHIVYLGEEKANKLYPPPSFFKATELVSALVRVLKHKEEEIIKAIEEKVAARRREERAQKLSEVNDRCEREMKKIEYAPADVLPARVLSESERRIIVEACDKELEGVDAKAAIDDFVVFCKLLSKTENRILVQSAQYVEKAVQSVLFLI